MAVLFVDHGTAEENLVSLVHGIRSRFYAVELSGGDACKRNGVSVLDYRRRPITECQLAWTQ